MLKQERLVRVQMKVHRAVSIKQERISHCLIRDNVYPYCERHGRRTIMVKLNGHPALSLVAV